MVQTELRGLLVNVGKKQAFGKIVVLGHIVSL